MVLVQPSRARTWGTVPYMWGTSRRGAVGCEAPWFTPNAGGEEANEHRLHGRNADSRPRKGRIVNNLTVPIGSDGPPHVEKMRMRIAFDWRMPGECRFRCTHGGKT